MPHGTIQPLVPILVFALVAVFGAMVLIAAGYLCNPRRVNPVKQMPYESGMDPVHPARRRMDIRFHLVAIAFLVFDVEVLILYPWAAAFISRQDNSSVSAQRTPKVASDFVAQRQATMVLANAGESQAVSEVARGSELSDDSPQNKSSAVTVGQPVTIRPGTAELAAAERRPLRTRPPYLFAAGVIFIVLLAVGYIYDWRKGVFDWR